MAELVDALLPISLIFLVVFIVVAPSLIYQFVWKKRGNKGEWKVATLLKRKLPEDYVVLNDVLIQKGQRSSQIDHVVVSQCGVFVIETKYYSGWILGREENESWTQSIYGHKSKFYNPIMQNAGHICALCEMFPELSPDIFIPVIAFSPRAYLLIRVSEKSNVVYYKGLIPKIKSYNEKILNLNQIKHIRTLLEPLTIHDKQLVQRHIEYAQKQQDRYNRKVESRICPRCGGELVYRQGKYGGFYGCSNYPKCRYILSNNR